MRVAERLDTDVPLASWTRAMRARNLSRKTISAAIGCSSRLQPPPTLQKKRAVPDVFCDGDLYGPQPLSRRASAR